MNPLGLLLQAFLNGQVHEQTDRLREAGARAAVAGRRVAIAGAFVSVAAIFFFCGILLGIIDLGLQVDRGLGISFSGLMLSSTILVFIGLISVFAGWVTSRQPQAIPEPPPPVPEPGLHKRELFTLLEQIAVALLKEFLENQKPEKTEPPQNP